MDIDTKIKAYRFVAYSAVVFSVIAVLSVCITLPIVYNYVHTVRRQLHSEAVLCKSLVYQLKPNQYKLENQEHLENPVLKDLQDLLDNQEWMEHLDSPELKVTLAQTVNLEPTETLVKLDQRDLLDNLENVESVLNTVPLMTRIKAYRFVAYSAVTFSVVDQKVHLDPMVIQDWRTWTPGNDGAPAMDLETRVKAYRFVAYSAVTFSVVAVLSVCVTLPMVYNYVHHVKRTMQNEVVFCRGTAKDIWSEVHSLKGSIPSGNRTARQAGYNDAAVHGGGGGGGGCEACCVAGPAGPYCAIDGGVFFEDGTRR
uniref:Col_cuticle_N domain-containing protein n=1 Tax=Heterorhabditis bacteriophora TaxID=37862 RepID=A0A1I7WN62_HETBA